jgi:hypothetical protein
MASEQIIPSISPFHDEITRSEPYVTSLVRLDVLPEVNEFQKEEIAAVKVILPEYDTPAVAVQPELFYPFDFAELIKRREDVRTGRVILNRGPEGNKRYQAAVNTLKSEGTDINDHVDKRIIKGSALVLVHDEFPAQLPADIDHFNLWFGKDPHDPEVIAASVMTCLNYLGKSIDDVVIAEKRRSARIEGAAYIAGVMPSVPRFRHMHLYVRNHTVML